MDTGLIRERRNASRAVMYNLPRVALRSTLGYLIMPRWGRLFEDL
ncbi:MAG: hypothetical protein ACK449_01300 [Planctomycetota bacterium]|jgi:hypothetical protein